MWRALFGVVLGMSLAWSAVGGVAAQEEPMDQAIWNAGEVGLAGDPAPADAPQQFQINGTILRIAYTANADEARRAFLMADSSVLRAATDPAAKPYGLFKQTDTTGEDAYLVLDLSWLAQQDLGEVPNLEVDQSLAGEHETVAVLLQQQPDNSFLAIQYAALSKGSAVNNTDFGVQERMTVHDDAINASGVCDDDENCGFFDAQDED
jgi:hypothetical protein